MQTFLIKTKLFKTKNYLNILLKWCLFMIFGNGNRNSSNFALLVRTVAYISPNWLRAVFCLKWRKFSNSKRLLPVYQSLLLFRSAALQQRRFILELSLKWASFLQALNSPLCLIVAMGTQLSIFRRFHLAPLLVVCLWSAESKHFGSSKM